MNIRKNTYIKICNNPICNAEFTCHHANQQYCSVRCKRNYERDQKKAIREKNLLNEKMKEQNANILEGFLNNNISKVTIEELKNRDFKANYYDTIVDSLHGEIIYIFKDYSLHRKNKNEFIITKTRYVSRNKHL